VEPDLRLAGVGADGERGGVAVLLGGGDHAAFPAQMIAAECGDVAGEDAAAQWCACCRRSEQVRVGVMCPHLQRWSAPVR